MNKTKQTGQGKIIIDIREQCETKKHHGSKTAMKVKG